MDESRFYKICLVLISVLVMCIVLITGSALYLMFNS